MKNKLQLLLLLITFYSNSQILDSTFGINGGIIEKSNSTSSSYDRLFDAKMQTDGKIVYVGRSVLNSSFVARTNIDGTLDSTFNFNGVKFLDITTSIVALSIQTDGRIVVTGINNVYRLNSDGSLDLSFSDDGILIFTPNIFTSNVYVQPDNKILVIGRIFDFGKNNFFISRLNQDGSYDINFGTNGILIQSIGTESDLALDIALQTDGKIIVTGNSKNGLVYGFATVRLNSNGIIDTSFGNLGIALYSNTGQKTPRSIGVQTDGKIIVVGNADNTLLVLRYNNNGTLDANFDTDGILNTTIPITTSIPNSQFVDNKAELSIQSSGKLLISLTSQDDFGLVQLNSNGSLDTTFGTNGITLLNNVNIEKTSFLILKPNGKIVIGGVSNNVGNTNYKIISNIVSSNGIFESSSYFNTFTSCDRVRSLIVQSSGKTLVLSDSYNTGNGNTQILTRYNTDGSLDLTFGVNGIIENLFADLNLFQQPDGKFLICNYYEIQRYSVDGILDTTFGNNGSTEFILQNPNPVDIIDNIVITSDSKILLAIDYLQGNKISFGVLKLNSNGSIDTTFGVNGFATARFNTFASDDIEFAASICINSLNEIIVSGYSRLNVQVPQTTSTSSLGILKFNQNGTLNTSFGINGKYSMLNNEFLYPNNIISLPNNQFIINSITNLSGLRKSISMKFNSNGSLDNSFGTNGIVNDTNFNNDMIVQNDGKILKTGSLNNQMSTTRFNSNGSLDNTFGNLGHLTTNVNSESKSNTIYQTINNQFLIGGYTITNQNVIKYAIARYTNTNLGNLNFNNTNNQILVYPNPIEESATFEYNLQNSDTISIDIFDLQGKKVKSIVDNKNIESGNQQQTIDLTNGFVTGNYILIFRTNFGSQSIQITKK